MKWGLIAASVLAVAIALVVVFMSRGKPEPATKASSEKMLEVRTLAGLPKVVDIGAGDASAAFTELVKFYDQESTTLQGGQPTAEVGDKAMALFIQVYEAGTLSTAFLDKTTPIYPQANPTFGLAPLGVASGALARINELRARDDAASKQRAVKGAQAVWAVGQIMFEKATRLPLRQQGLALMQSAGGVMIAWTEEAAIVAALDKWSPAIRDYTDNFLSPKLEVVSSLKPNIGDLLRIADADKDVTFRVEATLALARVKYNPRTKGNANGIADAIRKLQEDPDPMVQEAAKVAEAFTKEQLHGLR